jgi:hypothetical protein
MDITAFRLTFPELNTASDTLVTRFLASAARSIDSDLFGDRYDDAQGYLAAHLLCLSPYGKNARLSSDSGKTTYGTRYEEIRFEVVPSLMVP